MKIDWTMVSVIGSVAAPIAFLIFKAVAKRTPTKLDDEACEIIDEVVDAVKAKKGAVK